MSGSKNLIIVFMLLAGLFLIPKARSQSSDTNIENRFLFIFDTSADMKKRVPAVAKTFDVILATGIGGQLHRGDSIGVWTFGQDLRTGQFPLQEWEPTRAADIASNILEFVGKQHYDKKTSFEALQPALNSIVQNSERLT